MITDHGTGPESFQTDSDYWDCECPDDQTYIHAVSKGNFCPECHQHLDEDCRPESRVTEIAELYDAAEDNAVTRTTGETLMQRETTIKITYRWWRSCGGSGRSCIDPRHEEALEESAEERITAMRAEGCTSGQLHDNIRMGDEDGEDGMEYTGHWEVKTKTA